MGRSKLQARALTFTDVGIGNGGLLEAPNQSVDVVDVGFGREEQGANDLGPGDPNTRVV